jgi:hypothetical protein
MLFGVTVAVYCENHTEHEDRACGKNVEFYNVKAGGKRLNKSEDSFSLALKSISPVGVSGRDPFL